MNTPPRLVTSARLDAIVGDYERENDAERHWWRFPNAENMEAYRVHLLFCAQRAYADGFNGLGDAIMALWQETSAER